MGNKSNKSKKRRAAEEPTPAAPFNGAFAGLAGLRDALPAAEPAPADADRSGGDAEQDAPSGPAVPKRVILQREKKGRGGKTVTRVRGIEEDAPQWAKRLKKRLGCGATVEGEDVILLGDVGDAAEAFFDGEGVRVTRGN